MSVASIILVGGESRRFGSDKWKAIVKDQTLLEIAIERATAFSDDIYLSYHQPAQKKTICSVLQPSWSLSWVQDYTSLPQLSGPLLGIVSSVLELVRGDTEYLIVQPVDYPYLTSKTLEIMIEVMTRETIELLSFQTPEGYLTSTLVGINLQLTRRRLDAIPILPDPRLSNFYRSSFSTGIIPMIGQTNEFANVNNKSDLVQDNTSTRTAFGDLQIIRPGRHFQAYLAMRQKSKLVPVLTMRRQLELELRKWASQKMISEHISADINALTT